MKNIILWSLLCSCWYSLGQDTTLKVALWKPPKTLNPYFNKSIESEAIINLIYDSIYTYSKTNNVPSFASTAQDKDSSSEFSILKSTVKWNKPFVRKVDPEDIRFSFMYFNKSKYINATHYDNFLTGIKPINNSQFHVEFKPLTDMKTMKQQLDFKIINRDFAKRYYTIYDKMKGYIDEENDSDSPGLLENPGENILRIRDLLEFIDNKTYYKKNRDGSHIIYLKNKVKAFKKDFFLEKLNTADIAYTHYIFEQNFPKLGGSFGINQIQPDNEGTMATIKFNSRIFPTSLGPKSFLEMPLLIRSLTDSMTHTRDYWAEPGSNFKFKVTSNTIERITLERVDDSKGLAVNKIRFENKSGNSQNILDDLTNERIDIALNPNPMLLRENRPEKIQEVQTKGSHVIMVAINCQEKINGKENPLADYRVRLALNYILDKNELIKSHGTSTSKLMENPLTRSDRGVDINSQKIILKNDKKMKIRLNNDRKKAAHLLIEAGYEKRDHYWTKSGAELYLNFIYKKVQSNHDRLLVQHIFNQLDDFGIKVSLPRDSSLGNNDFNKALDYTRTWHLVLMNLFHISNTDLSIYNPELPAKNLFRFKPSSKLERDIKDLFVLHEQSIGEQRREIKRKLAEKISLETPAIFLWDFKTSFLINVDKVDRNNTEEPLTFNPLQFIDDFNWNK